MENKTQNTGVGFGGNSANQSSANVNGVPATGSGPVFTPAPGAYDPQPVASPTPTFTPTPTPPPAPVAPPVVPTPPVPSIPTTAPLPKPEPTAPQAKTVINPVAKSKKLKKALKILGLGLLILLLLVVAGLIFDSINNPGGEQQASVDQKFNSVQIPLDDLSDLNDPVLIGTRSLTINGPLIANDSFTLSPTTQPSNANRGQIYFDQNDNQLLYFNGTEFVPVASSDNSIQNIGGATGSIAVGGGLSVDGNTITNTGVTSIQGQTGAVNFVGGPGIAIDGTTINNTGLLSLGGASGNINVGNGLSVNGGTITNSGVTDINAGNNITVTDNGSGSYTISSTSGGGNVSTSGGTAGRIAKFTGVNTIEDSLLSESGATITVNGNLNVTGNTTLANALTVGNGGTGATSLANNGVVIAHGTNALTAVTAGAPGQCLLSTAGAPAFAACPSSAGVTSVNGQTGALTIANASAAAGTITINDASTTQKGIAQFNSTNFSAAGGVINTIQNINTGATPTFAGVNTNNITPSAALTVGASSQQLTMQGNASTQLAVTGGGSTTTIGFSGAPSGNVVYNFDRSATAGTYDICTTVGNCAGSGGGVTTPGGTAGTIAMFTAGQTIADSIITQSGLNVTITGDLSVVTGGLSLANALTVSNGGTGTTSLAGNGVLIGNGTAAISSVVAGAPNLCLLSTAGAPTWAACPTSGGVDSLNGLTGALSVANASASGSTITIDDASTSTKGIAQFNSTNFQASGGVINTIQNINTGATPTFAGVNTNNITPSGTLTVGATTEALVLQGDSSTTISATSGANSTTLSFEAPTATVVYRFADAAAGTYDVCTTIGNCVGTGGGVSTGGGTTNRLAKFTGAQAIDDSTITDDGTNVTTSVDLVVQGGELTVGVPSSQTGSVNLAHSGSGFTGTIVQGALTGNRTYTLPDANGTICLSSGNCSGSGSSNTLQAAYDAGNSITTTDGRDIDITLANTATDSNLDIVIADGSTGFTSFTRANGGGTSDPAQLILVDNLDTDRGIAAGIKIQSAAGGITNAIDATDADIVNALNAGANNIIGTTGDITFTNFSVDGTTGNVAASGNMNLSGGGQYQINGSQISSADLSNDSNLAKLSASQTFTGNLNAFRNGADSTNAFNVQNAAGTRILTVDSSNGQIALGSGSALDGKIVFSNVSNNNTVTILPGTPSANRTLTLPDASGIICTDSGNCAGAGATLQTAYNFSVGGTTPKIKVDNTLLGVDIQDADTTIGANLFNIRASNAAGLGSVLFGVGNTGQVTLQNSANSTTAFQLLTQGGTNVLTGDTTNGRIILGQGSTLSGSILFNNATNSNTLNLTTAATTGNRTITLPDASGTVCLQNSSSCGFVPGTATDFIQNQNSVDQTANLRISGTARANTSVLTPAVDVASAGTLSVGTSTATAVTVGNSTNNSAVTIDSGTGAISIGTGAQARTISIGTGAAAQTLNIGSTNTTSTTNINAGTGGLNLLTNSASASITAKSSTNGTAAFRVLNASDVPLFQIDTTNNRIYAGNPTADTTGALLILDTKNSSGDPTAVAGGMYHNSTTGRNRCVEDRTWKDCGGIPRPIDRQTVMQMADGSTTNWTGWGTAMTNTGTTGTSTSPRNSISHTTTATSGNVAGSTSATFLDKSFDTSYALYQSQIVFSQNTSQRAWIGLSSVALATMGGSSAPASGAYAAFRHDTSAGDTTLKCVMRTGGVVTTADSGVSITATVSYRFEILMDFDENQSNPRTVFRIGQLDQPMTDVCTMSDNIIHGNGAARYGFINSITTLTAATRAIRVGWLYSEEGLYYTD